MLFAICCPPDACCRSIRQKREANGRCNFESPMLSLTRSGLQSGATAIAAAAPSWAMARGAAARPHRLDKSRLRRICECPQDCRSQGPRCNPRTNTCSTPLLTRWKFVPLLAVKMFPSCRVFHERKAPAFEAVRERRARLLLPVAIAQSNLNPAASAAQASSLVQQGWLQLRWLALYRR